MYAYSNALKIFKNITVQPMFRFFPFSFIFRSPHFTFVLLVSFPSVFLPSFQSFFSRNLTLSFDEILVYQFQISKVSIGDLAIEHISISLLHSIKLCKLIVPSISWALSFLHVHLLWIFVGPIFISMLKLEFKAFSGVYVCVYTNLAWHVQENCIWTICWHGFGVQQSLTSSIVDAGGGQ